MYGCKYLNFSRSKSEMELLARKKIQELEGDEGEKYISEYADGRTTVMGDEELENMLRELDFNEYERLSHIHLHHN
jgi:amidophosphoribosyltransferase